MNTFTLAIPGLTIACKSWGNPKAPLILALHGWLDNANSFDLLAPYLAEDFYLVAVDLPGHGHSTHLPPGCYYHFIDGIFTTVQIINALQRSRIHLLGHSLGACLASLVAGVATDRVISSAFLEALGPITASETSCQQQLVQYMQHGLPLENDSTKSYRSIQEAARVRAQRGYLSAEHAKIICERGLYEKNGAFYWRHDKRLQIPSPLRMTEMQVLSCLSAITAKCILCWADQGFAFDKEDMQARMKAVKHLEVTQLAGGHHIHMEKPEAVGNILVDFFRKTTP